MPTNILSFNDSLNSDLNVKRCLDFLANASIEDLYGIYPGTLFRLIEMPGCRNNKPPIMQNAPISALIYALDTNHIVRCYPREEQNEKKEMFEKHVLELMMVPFLKGNDLDHWFNFTPYELFRFFVNNNMRGALRDNTDLAYVYKFTRDTHDQNLADIFRFFWRNKYYDELIIAFRTAMLASIDYSEFCEENQTLEAAIEQGTPSDDGYTNPTSTPVNSKNIT